MGYNNQSLEKVMEYCRQCGDLQMVKDIIESAKNNETKKIEIFCHSKKDAARKQRNLYKVLWFYPEIKPIIQIQLAEMNLTILIGHKTEKRGRRPK